MFLSTRVVFLYFFHQKKQSLIYYKALAAFKVACASGFGAPHSGHATFDPNTKRRWFAQLEFGHCQSPSRVEATLSMTQTSNFEPKTATDTRISGARKNGGTWGNIPIPTLHEIWFSSSFWVDFLLQEKIIGKRPSQHPTGVWSVQTQSLPFETWGNSTSHTGLGSIWNGAKEFRRLEGNGQHSISTSSQCQFLDAPKKCSLKNSTGKRVKSTSPFFCGNTFHPPFIAGSKKKMHGSRHSVHSHPPKQDGWFGVDLSLQLSPTISRWAQTKIIHSLVGTEPSSNHPAGLFSRSKCQKKTSRHLSPVFSPKKGWLKQIYIP